MLISFSTHANEFKIFVNEEDIIISNLPGEKVNYVYAMWITSTDTCSVGIFSKLNTLAPFNGLKNSPSNNHFLCVLYNETSLGMDWKKFIVEPQAFSTFRGDPNKPDGPVQPNPIMPSNAKECVLTIDSHNNNVKACTIRP